MQIRRLRYRDRALVASAEPGLAKALSQVCEAGLARVERCFIATDARGSFDGLIAYSDPDDDGAVIIELLYVPWGADYRSAGRALLEASLARLPSRPSSLEYILDEPHPWHARPHERRLLLTALGFDLLRTTWRWEWRRKKAAPVRAADRLTYRSVHELGFARFADALRRVLDGSQDRRLRAERERLGEEEASRRHAKLLLALDHDSDGYALAFDSAALVGLFAAARVGAYPVIALIGVVPEHRMRGHGLALLRAATAHHATVNEAVCVRADSDMLNAPMARCFTRARYRRFATRSEYRREMQAIR